MKKLILLLILVLPLLASAQKTTHTVTFDGISRYYIKYVPPIYDGTTPVPLLFALHGFGDNADNFSNLGFEQLANTENFIVITPEAIPDPLSGSTAWNSGAGVTVGQNTIVLNENIKDKEWISALIDEMAQTYNIDENRVYTTGFSMGSFMSHRLACEMNDRIAAIASVAGAIGNGIDCVPARSFPMCHFHGTADGTIAYTGNLYGTDAEETVAFWATNNGCDASPTATELPDLFDDGFTVTHEVYNGCENDVEFYIVANAPHSWLFSNNDISYTLKIWEFLSRQSLDGGSTNSAPSAQDDVAETPENTDVVIDVTANDSDSDGSIDPTSVTITDGPDHGSVSVDPVTGDITYTPDPGYFGPDHFEYSVCDDGDPARCVTAQVDVTVTQIISAVLEDLVQGLEVYPNPMSSAALITIHLEKNESLYLELIDVAGSKVLSSALELNAGLNQIPLDVANFARGIYMLTLTINGKTAGSPVILQ